MERRAHDHVFGQDRVRPGERRTILVISITAAMMIVEVTAGILFGSMALLADGLHMASHATALGIAAFAYIYVRRHARDPRYTFGTGKVNSLAGFAGAILLAVFALVMAYESVGRLLHPVPIGFNQAILVAVLGLLVNGICVYILGNDHEHEHKELVDEGVHGVEHHEHHHHDHNLRSAYLHVLADALTSVTAIVALLTGKYFGWVWMDPAMGIVGSLVVIRWAWGLLRSASAVLLDRQAPEAVIQSIRGRLEAEGDVQVLDLHVWAIGPCVHATQVTIAAQRPQAPDYYKAMLPPEAGLVHVALEVHTLA